MNDYVEVPFPRDGMFMYGLNSKPWRDAHYQKPEVIELAATLAADLVRAWAATDRSWAIFWQRDFSQVNHRRNSLWWNWSYDIEEMAGLMLHQLGLELGVGHRRFLVGRPSDACSNADHDRQHFVMDDGGVYICRTCHPEWKRARRRTAA